MGSRENPYLESIGIRHIKMLLSVETLLVV